jgi:hypothetical protein
MEMLANGSKTFLAFRPSGFEMAEFAEMAKFAEMLESAEMTEFGRWVGSRPDLYRPLLHEKALVIV